MDLLDPMDVDVTIPTKVSLEQDKDLSAQTTVETVSDTPSVTRSIIQGYPDQVCETVEILKEIQTRYAHILSNEFKGRAKGKIGQQEAMVCDCEQDRGSATRFC